MREDSDEYGETNNQIVPKTPFEFGRGLLNEKIVIQLVEKIDLHSEIQNLMKLQTFSVLPQFKALQFHKIPVTDIITAQCLLLDNKDAKKLQCICWNDSEEGLLVKCTQCSRY